MAIKEEATFDKPAVAIVGGGIAGIQASLELANSGFKVYIIEKDISIGGIMAQLDKTFPTNDCSTCMISPRFIEVASNPNIEIITRAKVISLDGEAGNFRLKVLVEPRFIDEKLCTACGQCANVCPIEVSDYFNRGLRNRKAVYKHFPQAIPSAYAIDKAGKPPCKVACPANISIEGFIALIRQGLYKEAIKLIKRNNPLPAVCGRICPHPCETLCYRGGQDEPIAIEELKRFVADRDLFSEDPYIPEKKPPKNKRVAIIGSGPAGLTASYYLAIEGYEVVVFEAMDKPGGMLQYGIPSFRLDKRIVEKEIEIIKKLGVSFKTEVFWGKDFTLSGLKRDGFDAIFIAVGACKPIELGIPGEHLRNVYHGVDFLKAICMEDPLKVGKRVAVIGGGNVALDVARSALRLGAEKVTVLYRRGQKEMPVTKEELEEALEEGINIEYLTGCVELLGDTNGNVRAVRCIRMELGAPDESGRRRPIPVEGSFFEIEADTVISAIGQQVSLPMLSKEPPETRPELSRNGTILVDPITYETSVKGIFAGGDAVFGPSTVILAIASGKEAAISIARYLEGQDLKEGRTKDIKVADRPFKLKPTKRRIKASKIPLEDRLRSFDEIVKGFTEEEAKEEASRCLECGICSECYLCEDACLSRAVKHGMSPEELELNVAGVIVASGFVPFDASKKAEYGYGRYANIITSIEFERILSASGPTGGEIKCPKDGSHPKKIAWIQCVGSRDVSIGREYCSAVCCMYATKQAMVAKEHDPQIEATIFFMDMRALGKGFDRYYDRAKNQYGIRYIRSNISRVVEIPKSGKIEIHYVNESNELISEIFDLVVLSVGITPSGEIAGFLGLQKDQYGFIGTDPFDVVKTNIDGVFVCGAVEGPKDIPESVVQAYSAASSIMALAKKLPSANEESLKKPLPKTPARDEKCRIGVFICHCGINIAGVVDVKALSRYAKNLPEVVYSEDIVFCCAPDGTKKIKEAIEQYNLNRIVVASCSPRTHEQLFRQVITQAGVNKYLFEMANIRDQCSWVHAFDSKKATEKAKSLVRMAVAKARFLEPIEEFVLPIEQSALVIGGGPSGMVASLQLAKKGYPVTLVEKEDTLGGNALRWSYFHHSGKDVQGYVKSLMEEVSKATNIKVLLNAEVTGFEGRPGDFKIKVRVKDAIENQIRVGTIIVATGAEEYKGTEYLWGVNKKVITQREFQKEIASLNPTLPFDSIRHVVMIQCVGSRNETHPYCSKICCTLAILNAIKFKELCPDANVTIFYRDIRTYGKKELLYYEARRKGIVFLRYTPDSPPEVEEIPETGKFRIRYFDKTLNQNFVIPANLVVLSAGIVAPHTNKHLSKLLKLSLDPDGFFTEAHVKLKPLDTSTPGIFLCGLSQGPKFLEECISQAKGASARAYSFLSQKYMVVSGSIARVNHEECSRCLTCVRICPYDAPSIQEAGEGGKASAVIDPALCQGCGACVVACPAKAIQLGNFTDEQLLAKVEALFESL